MPIEKKHIITISGRPGSGKSTTAKLAAAELSYDHFSSGDLFRAVAREQGVNLLDANLSAEQNSEIDTLVDTRLQEIGKTEDRQVIDSRTAWHWMPGSFKVFLDLDIRTAAERILSEIDDERSSSEHVHDDIDAYADTLQARLDSESRRYRKLYDIDPYDMTSYDLVVDTQANSIADTLRTVLEAYDAWLKS